MNLKQLQFALAVAESGSFSRAAELCHASQPTLSNAIALLETELGGRLFSRTTRSVTLTPFGDYLLPRIRDTLNSRDELVAAAKAYHDPKHRILRLGFSPLVDMRRLDQAIAPFRQAHPEINIFFKECFIDELSNRLLSEQIDLRIIPAAVSQPSEERCAFYTDSLCYLPAQTDDSPGGTPIRLTDLPATPIILTGGGCGLGDVLSAVFTSENATFEAYPGQAISYSVIEDWASLGVGAGILPGAKVSPGNRHRCPLRTRQGEPACIDYVWAWHANRNRPAYLQEFLDYIATLAPEIVKGQFGTG